MLEGLDRREFAFLVLAALFMAALVACNLIAGKFVTLDLGFTTFVVSAGILPYPVTFLVTDIVSEAYGRRRANQLVLAGFVASVFVLGILQLAMAFPAIQGSGVSDASFEQVFGRSQRVIFASMVAYLVAQLVDIHVFHFWKRVTAGRHLWLRNNASTIFSQLVDTTLVIGVLFWGEPEWPLARIGAAILDGWLFKVLCALVDTPFFYAGSWLFERHLPAGRGPHTTFA